MSNLIFLDVETTGLEPEKHEVWEIAYAIDKGPIMVAQLPHSLVRADPDALNLNNYWTRAEPSRYRNNHGIDVALGRIFDKAMLVAANPTFDRMMLRARWGMEPWHHRSIDIETMAMTVFDVDRPLSMAQLTDALRNLGYDIPVPDHSAKGDVEALRLSYYALKNEQKKYVEAYHRKPYSA